MAEILVVCLVAYCTARALMGEPACEHNVKSLQTANNRWWWECAACGEAV